jgi:hypothetical protein
VWLVLNKHSSEMCERHGRGRSTIEAGVKSRDYAVADINMVGRGVDWPVTRLRDYFHVWRRRDVVELARR